MGRKQKRRGGEAKGRKPSRAERADRYALYLASVQDPEVEVEFLDREYRRFHRRAPRVLREDFCGTFAVCCAWAAKRGRQAIAVDLDPEPLAWGRAHNLARLAPAARSRVEIRQADVRTVAGPKVDILAAQNFSYWIFKTRPAMLEYFRAARANLREGGIFALDAVGGPESYETGEQDVRPMKGFKYVWDLERYDPVSRDVTFHIHFRFPDGSRLDEAFVYDWRYWTIPEIRELLAEAGFRESHVYWEGVDEETGEGSGEYEMVERGTNDASWVAYILAIR